MNKFITIVLLGLFCSSCFYIGEPEDSNDDFKTKGLKPVYIAKELAKEIKTETPMPIMNPGKIYKKYPFIFINERGKGIHIVDNRNNKSPQKISFINIPGNIDIAVKNNILYADNFEDLIALDITDPTEVKIISRVEKALPEYTQTYPEGYSGYFECVDPNKGYVIEWVEAQLQNPKCSR